MAKPRFITGKLPLGRVVGIPSDEKIISYANWIVGMLGFGLDEEQDAKAVKRFRKIFGGVPSNVKCPKCGGYKADRPCVACDTDTPPVGACPQPIKDRIAAFGTAAKDYGVALALNKAGSPENAKAREEFLHEMERLEAACAPKMDIPKLSSEQNAMLTEIENRIREKRYRDAHCVANEEVSWLIRLIRKES